MTFLYPSVIPEQKIKRGREICPIDPSILTSLRIIFAIQFYQWEQYCDPHSGEDASVAKYPLIRSRDCRPLSNGTRSGNRMKSGEKDEGENIFECGYFRYFAAMMF